MATAKAPSLSSCPEARLGQTASGRWLTGDLQGSLPWAQTAAVKPHYAIVLLASYEPWAEVQVQAPESEVQRSLVVLR